MDAKHHEMLTLILFLINNGATMIILFFSSFARGGVATFVAVYNALCVVGYQDFDGVLHQPIVNPEFSLPLLFLPLGAFTLSSPALALILGACVRSCTENCCWWAGDISFPTLLLLFYCYLLCLSCVQFSRQMRPLNVGTKDEKLGV